MFDSESQGVAAVLPPRYTAITLRQRLLVRLFLHPLQGETVFSPHVCLHIPARVS